MRTDREARARRGATGIVTGMSVMTLWLCPVALSARELAIDIKNTSVEQLMQIKVTSVTRYEQELQPSAAAVYVLRRDDLRRARVNSVPEALRLVPGVQVARIDANKWAVTIRGFNGRTANKLLVLVDGRTIYDPLFAGVFWEARDVPIAEIERIEVIRGPGGTLWGSNAVNGVINIITRSAADTHGGLLIAGAGTEDRFKGGAHYGWKAMPGFDVRVYGDAIRRDNGYSASGANDDARLARGGLRADWQAGAHDTVMFKIDAFDGTFGTQTATGSQDIDHHGSSFVTRWTRAHDAGVQTTAQLWYDIGEFIDMALEEQRKTWDIELQHARPVGERHHLVFGAGARRTSDDIVDGPVLGLEPNSRADDLSNIYAQDVMSFLDDRLQFTLGAKLERNDYSGSEWQPNARLAWIPNPDHTLWTAVSRAIRAPSRLESDLTAPPFLSGNPNLEAEQLTAYEAGYRTRFAANAWLDFATFYNDYRRLLSVEGTTLANKMHGQTIGGEIAARWQPVDQWQFELGYSYLDLDLNVDPGSLDAARAQRIESNEPRHQTVLRGNWVPGGDMDLNMTIRYVDRLRSDRVGSYVVTDIGAGWTPRDDMRLSAIAQNLFNDHHHEQGRASATGVERGYYMQFEWGFL